MNQSPKQSANIEFKLCPPSLSRSFFAHSNSSVGTQKRFFLGPGVASQRTTQFAVAAINHDALMSDKIRLAEMRSDEIR